MTQQNPAFDPAVAAHVVKTAAILTIGSYINKVAELAGETPLTDAQLVAVSVRAGEQLPDSIATTLHDPAVTAGIIQKLTDASMELANSEPKTPSVTPEDVQLQNIGDGQVLQQVAGNPHANTGGIELKTDVKMIETNLFAGKKAGLNNNPGIGEVPMNQQALTNKLAAQDKIIAEQGTKIASLTEAVQNVVQAITKLAEAEIPAAVDQQQGNNPVTVPTQTGTETPAKVDDKTKDLNQISTDAAGASTADMAGKGAPNPNPNPDAGKIAKYQGLLDVVKKYKK